MKFNALVVAAMVITSVNAGWRKKDAGGNRHNDGRRTLKGPLGLTVRPLVLTLPPKSSESELSPALSPKSPVRPLSLVLPSTSSENNGGTSQKSDHPKKPQSVILSSSNCTLYGEGPMFLILRFRLKCRFFPT
ncbi:hypothetical protein BASA61_004444 [Batrachochytrium salamandrivorans]|nr:hypothetical protein BASA60_004575 [Batrachochytrium salamandrivorans]KAH6592734.1 hypothetical protein BASA61_004444 [Batrachochytrium salamandrivorans]KAH9272566.1 hypothetical protein BASA83_005066 [Batrachochytrium salamandrivorans]